MKNIYDDIKRILIIEDNEEIVESISLVLNIHWCNLTIDSTERGDAGLKMLGSVDYDLVILDLGLPDISGFEVLKSIRLFSNIPVVILTVKGDEPSVVKGLEMGANEYIVKPFRQLEFISRLRKLIRHELDTRMTSPIIHEQFHLYPEEQKLIYNENEIYLTHTETIIMNKLMVNAGHVVTHEQMSESIWGNCHREYTPMLKTYIQRLRKKVETAVNNPDFILTKHGLGYYIAKK
jgi:two-component system KDP operon response regulator KdpE